jgi:hypothetical protein
MPLFHINGGWKWGKHGKLYVGAYGYEKALRQMRAINISKARRYGHKIPYRPARHLVYVKSRLRIVGRRKKLHRRPITHKLRYGRGY